MNTLKRIGRWIAAIGVSLGLTACGSVDPQQANEAAERLLTRAAEVTLTANLVAEPSATASPMPAASPTLIPPTPTPDLPPIYARCIMRSQADLLLTIRQAQADPATARQRIQAHIDRFTDSPTPGYNDYLRASIQHGCRQIALLHNSSTPQQRQRAVNTLRQYESDLRGLVHPG